MVEVWLTPEEMYLGAVVGVMQRVKSIFVSRIQTNGAESRDPFGMSAIGAMGEIAYCKAAGCYWFPRLNAERSTDYGGVQIRTAAGFGGRLLMHKWDSDSDRFVLVCGVPPRYRIVGWILGKEGKLPEFWNARMPTACYAVPQEKLTKGIPTK